MNERHFDDPFGGDHLTIKGDFFADPHTKVEMSRTDLLRLLSYLEGELQARDVVIATLKSEKAKQFLYQAKYGRLGLNDPLAAFQRDSESLGTTNDFDESTVGQMYDSQLVQLERLISSQKAAQQRMRQMLSAAEKRHAKVVRELEEERRKRAADTAQGDDVFMMLEKERERLKQEIELEKSQQKKADKELKKLQTSFEDEKQRHKQVVLFLLTERKQLNARLMEERHKSAKMAETIRQLTGVEGQDVVKMIEDLRLQVTQIQHDKEKLSHELHKEREETASLREIIRTQEEDLSLIRQNILAKSREMKKANMLSSSNNSHSGENHYGVTEKLNERRTDDEMLSRQANSSLPQVKSGNSSLIAPAASSKILPTPSSGAQKFSPTGSTNVHQPVRILTNPNYQRSPSGYGSPGSSSNSSTGSGYSVRDFNDRNFSVPGTMPIGDQFEAQMNRVGNFQDMGRTEVGERHTPTGESFGYSTPGTAKPANFGKILPSPTHGLPKFPVQKSSQNGGPPPYTSLSSQLNTFGSVADGSKKLSPRDQSDSFTRGQPYRQTISGLPSASASFIGSKGASPFPYHPQDPIASPFPSSTKITSTTVRTASGKPTGLLPNSASSHSVGSPTPSVSNDNISGPTGSKPLVQSHSSQVERISSVQQRSPLQSNEFERAAEGVVDGSSNVPTADVRRTAVKKSRSFDSGSTAPHPQLGYAGRAGSFQADQTDNTWLTDAIEPEMVRLQMAINSLSQADSSAAVGNGGPSGVSERESEPPDPVVTKPQYAGLNNNISSQHHSHSPVVSANSASPPVHNSLAVIVENKPVANPTLTTRKLPAYGGESPLMLNGPKLMKKRPPTPTPTPLGSTQFPISIHNSPNVTVHIEDRSGSRPAPMSKTNPTSLSTSISTVKRVNKFMLKKRSASATRPLSNVAPTAVDSPPADLIANGRAEVRKLVDRRLLLGKSDSDSVDSGSSGTDDKSGLKMPSTPTVGRKSSGGQMVPKSLQFPPIRKSSASQTPRQREFTVV